MAWQPQADVFHHDMHPLQPVNLAHVSASSCTHALVPFTHPSPLVTAPVILLQSAGVACVSASTA